MTAREAEPRWLVEARKYVGLKEGPGALNDPTVMAFYAETGNGWVREDSVPWCAAFVGAVLRRAGMRIPAGGDALRARAYQDVGKPIAKGSPGAICVFSRGASPSQGHVAFFVGETAAYVDVLGGNQADQVNVSRYSKSRLVGIYWPTPAAVAAPPPARKPLPIPDLPKADPPRPPSPAGTPLYLVVAMALLAGLALGGALYLLQ